MVQHVHSLMPSDVVRGQIMYLPSFEGGDGSARALHENKKA